MKKTFYLILFFLITSCSNNKNFKTVYWCGDHPCINKKERQNYFKKTMVVEIKDLDDKNDIKNSDTDKLIEQAKLNQKKQLKDEKKLLKEAKLERKRKLIEEKKMKKDEKRRAKQEKKFEKKNEKR